LQKLIHIAPILEPQAPITHSTLAQGGQIINHFWQNPFFLCGLRDLAV
jgi:hypothetical protein